MYIEIGSFNAKAQLSKLLHEVQLGRCYTITLRGRPVADLIPSEQATVKNAHTAIEAMRQIHKIKGVSPATVSELITEGRR
ncbi:MAG: type II toxin-antitoxin system prevent-host-death family antitoxin [Gammaproteobacteria bacterium]|nr:type II toxin-antitoxin system prevent-host-death family antitoxin [Gammaproteobacteria bacterium]